MLEEICNKLFRYFNDLQLVTATDETTGRQRFVSLGAAHVTFNFDGLNKN